MPWRRSLAVERCSVDGSWFMTETLASRVSRAQGQESRPAGNQWSFVGWTLSNLFVPLGSETSLALHRVVWWVHVLTVLGFLAYLPHSKHLHIVTAPFNVWLRTLAPKGQLPYLNVEEALEQEKPLGAAEIAASLEEPVGTETA